MVWVEGLGFTVQSVRCGVWGFDGLGFTVCGISTSGGSGLEIHGLGCKVWGLGV